MEFLADPRFWVAIAFGVFAILMAKPVGGFIARSLDSRSDRIRDELAEAVRLREEAQVVLTAYLAKQAEVAREAEEIVAKTKSDAASMLKAAQEDMKAALEKRTRLATERIAQAESRALAEVQNHMVDIAISAARAIIKDQLGKGGNDELMKAALSDIERKIH